MIFMSDLQERIYSWLLKKARNNTSGKVRATGLTANLCRDIINDPIEIRKSLDNLRRDGKVEYSATSNGEPISAYIIVIAPAVEVKEHEMRWIDALKESDLNESEIIALAPLYVAMEGINSDQMKSVITGLTKLRSDQPSLFGNPIFNISAKYLIGSSKLLSSLNNRALKTFGIEIDRFVDRPPYIIVGGNSNNPEAVILVENPISFETAIQSSASLRCAFVCTFGFGLSNQGNDYGNQLAGAIESGSSKLLHRNEGKWKDLNSLLSHQNLHFWGDLDMAGIQIYERIATKLPHVNLSALYRPMLKALDSHHSRHPYIECVGKVGQKKFSASRTGSIFLLNICQEWAVDQEIVTVKEIETLAGQELYLPNEDVNNYG